MYGFPNSVIKSNCRGKKNKTFSFEAESTILKKTFGFGTIMGYAKQINEMT
jgi:hypothetical protein